MPVAARDTRALVRRALLQHGPLSRAELADRTALSRPAITEICQELAALGQIRETGTRALGRSALGRRRVQLDLVPQAGYALGILVAAENSAITVLDLTGQLVDSVRVRPPSGTAQEVLSFLASAAQDRVGALNLPRGGLLGVGVSVPGVVDASTGRLRLSPFFQWVDVPVRVPFEARFGRRVHVANPLHAIAVAEMLFGSASHLARADLLLVNVSTGIGAAFVLGGQLQHGADQASGQIGHVLLDPGGRRCRCGRRGCLDAAASGDALVAIARENGLVYESFSALLDDAQRGHRPSLELLDESAHQVGQVVGDLITAVNPAVVAVSGMVLELGTRYVDQLRKTAIARAWMTDEAPPRIVPSAFGVQAGAVGSAALALEQSVYAAD